MFNFNDKVVVNKTALVGTITGKVEYRDYPDQYMVTHIGDNGEEFNSWVSATLLEKLN